MQCKTHGSLLLWLEETTILWLGVEVLSSYHPLSELPKHILGGILPVSENWHAQVCFMEGR